jgi:hypothetical protein
MKKILLFAAIALSMVSCLTKGAYSQSYTADITFEYQDQVYKNEFGKDSVYVCPKEEDQGFLYLQFPLFFGQRQAGGKLAGGFVMSYLTGEKDGLLEKEPSANDEFRVHAAMGSPDGKAGAAGSKTYAVFYDNPQESMMPKYDIEFGYKNNGSCSPFACYVNNTTLVARKVREHFQDGDRLVLKAKGTKLDGSVSEASIVLAEYTESKDTVMYNWTIFDLSKLGAVDFVDFEVVSTNPQVPGYFCLDGYFASISISY